MRNQKPSKNSKKRSQKIIACKHLSGKCTEFHRGPLVPFSDCGKSVKIVESSGLHKTRADSCLYISQVSCDFVASSIGVGDLFIELKGVDLDHGVVQIQATLVDWKKKGWSSGAVAGLLVCARYPRHDSKIQRARSKFAREYAAPLHVVCSKKELNFKNVMRFDGPS